MYILHFVYIWQHRQIAGKSLELNNTKLILKNINGQEKLGYSENLLRLDNQQPNSK